MKKHIICLGIPILIWCNLLQVSAQSSYPLSIDVSRGNAPIISGHLKLGSNYNKKGDTLSANNQWYSKNGKPWFPIMGEFHYSRFPKHLWEESILKIKASGVDIIATYVFWIYHEEEEGIWNWKDRNDLNYFASLCKKHNIYLLLRIGPWCHGEVRNGGHPDWLLKKKLKLRSSDSAYLHYTNILFKQIHVQAKDYYFKNNGTIIGVQLENEFKFSDATGLKYMLALKKMAVDAKIDVPYYTATGWPSPDLKQTDLIPMWGGYPEAPWNSSTKELPLYKIYKFDTLRVDKGIGSDLINYLPGDSLQLDGYLYPYSTAELGGGIQVTYHRRPIIAPADITTIATYKVGSGANLLGYYMYHGGTNQSGKLSTLQESKASGYPNDYTIINYDFQAPLGQWGETHPSYNAFKKLHLFLNDFGDRIAPTAAFFPEKNISSPADTQTLRWAVRSNGTSGFVFITNYQRLLKLPSFNNVQFSLQLKNNTNITFPVQPFVVPSDAQMVIPFNMDINGALLNYATAQPLCILKNSEPSYIFYQLNETKAVYSFSANTIRRIVQSKNVTIQSGKGNYEITVTNPGLDCYITIEKTDGKKVNIITLTEMQALQAFKNEEAGVQRLYISGNELLFNANDLHITSVGSNRLEFYVYPDKIMPTTLGTNKIKRSKEGWFGFYSSTLTEKKITVSYKEDLEIANSLPAKKETSAKVSMPEYSMVLEKIPGAKYYRVSIPKNILSGLKDAMIEVDYAGDTKGVYLDSKLIADNFYLGQTSVISARQFKGKIEGNDLILLITPLSDEKNIYFMKGVRDSLLGKTVAEIKSIKIIPVYEMVIKGGK